jgi:hypothetical protein
MLNKLSASPGTGANRLRSGGGDEGFLFPKFRDKAGHIFALNEAWVEAGRRTCASQSASKAAPRPARLMSCDG